ncbi:MAG: calcium/sodium antiporter [Patescibacteria group bacterium]
MLLFLIIFGLGLLLFGAQFLVDASIGIARRFKISEFVIGLTLVTIGTSIPELVVSITGAVYRMRGVAVSDLVVGEIVGSDIGQIGLVLGLVGLFGAIDMKRKALFYQSVFMIGSVVLLFIFGQDYFLSRLEGMTFLGLYLLYIIPIGRGGSSVRHGTKKKKSNLWVDWSKLIIGLIGIVFGAKMAIDNSVLLADQFHISKTFIGIFILGFGTSLPELVVAITAYIKRAKGISIGNIIGSNIFDTLVGLGAGASLVGFNIDSQIMNFDIPFLLFLSVIVVVFFYTKKSLEKKESILIISLYGGYVLLKLLSLS